MYPVTFALLVRSKSHDLPFTQREWESHRTQNPREWGSWRLLKSLSGTHRVLHFLLFGRQFLKIESALVTQRKTTDVFLGWNLSYQVKLELWTTCISHHDLVFPQYIKSFLMVGSINKYEFFILCHELCQHLEDCIIQRNCSISK